MADFQLANAPPEVFRRNPEIENIMLSDPKREDGPFNANGGGLYPYEGVPRSTPSYANTDSFPAASSHGPSLASSGMPQANLPMGTGMPQPNVPTSTGMPMPQRDPASYANTDTFVPDQRTPPAGPGAVGRALSGFSKPQSNLPMGTLGAVAGMGYAQGGRVTKYGSNTHVTCRTKHGG